MEPWYTVVIVGWDYFCFLKKKLHVVQTYTRQEILIACQSNVPFKICNFNIAENSDFDL